MKRIPWQVWVVLGVTIYGAGALHTTKRYAAGKCPRASKWYTLEGAKHDARGEAVAMGLFWPVSLPLLALSEAAQGVNPKLRPCQQGEG